MIFNCDSMHKPQENERNRFFQIVHLRTFARKFSNFDFFLKILPLKDDGLVMSEM